MLSNSSLQEAGVPSRLVPSWAWIDQVFRDGDWRRSFKIEESHEGDSIVIRAELPGVDPEKDVTVDVVDGELVIRAQRSESRSSEKRHVHRSEFRYGSFTRMIPLPSGVDESTMAATYKDGILEVRFHSPSEVTSQAAHHVQVKRG
jgi:HSP20 family protein